MEGVVSKIIGIDFFFKEFCCKGEQRNRAEPGKKDRIFSASILFSLLLPSLHSLYPL
jgi:hypothetical protein